MERADRFHTWDNDVGRSAEFVGVPFRHFVFGAEEAASRF